MGIITALKDLFAGKAFEPSAEELYRQATDYHVGRNTTPTNYQKAVEFYAQAAEKGHLESMYYLHGMLEEKERILHGNRGLAVQLLAESAERGFDKSQFDLYLKYRYGEGVPEDIIQAHKFISLVEMQDSNSGHIDLTYARMMWDLEEKMSEEQIAEAQNLASAWKPKTGALPDDIVQGLRQIYAPTVNQTVKPKSVNLG